MCHGLHRGQSYLGGLPHDATAADLVDLMDALHIEGAVLGGLSLGGYVVFALLRLAPAYVQGLILADTRPQADAPAALENRQRMITMVESKGPQAVAEEMLPKLVGETTRRERPDVVAGVTKMILGNTTEGIAGAVRAMMGRPDSTPLLSSIRCPTLVVVGDEDTLTPPSLSEEMAREVTFLGTLDATSPTEVRPGWDSRPYRALSGVGA